MTKSSMGKENLERKGVKKKGEREGENGDWARKPESSLKR